MDGFNEENINLCCWLTWFGMVNGSLNQTIKDVLFLQEESRYTGILLCPDCLGRKLLGDIK